MPVSSLYVIQAYPPVPLSLAMTQLHSPELAMPQTEQTESGWTSYLHTECASLFSFSYSSYDHHSHAHSADDELHSSPKTRVFNEHSIHAVTQNGNTNADQAAAAAAGNCKNNEREKSMDIPSEESCGSSTLSDANSPCGSPPRKRRSSPWNLQHKFKRRRAHKLTAHSVASRDHLEDTATSSPSSSPQNDKDMQPEVSWNCKEGDTFKRFKALEAFIPSLGELLVENANEEEVLIAIISHVRALERKVQLLSDVWQSTRGEDG